MGPAFQRKYATGTGADIYLPMIVAGSQNFAGSGDWTPATGDVKISIDGGAQANIGTLPAYTNGSWKFVFADAELTGKKMSIRIVDSATKAVEDQAFEVETFGHASAAYPKDFGATDANQTGDAYARLGAPSGASIAADILAIFSRIGAPSGASIAADVLALFTRLGAPAGASTAADIAAAKAVVDAIKAKTDLIPAAGPADAAYYTPTRGPYLDELAAANIPADVDTLLSRLSSARAGYLDKLNITGNVASSAEVTTIQNNTTTRIALPSFFERPDAGSDDFVLDLYIYDEQGTMEAPDSIPTLTVVNQAGTDRSGNLTNAGIMTLIGVGHYRISYTVASGHAIEQLRFEFTVIEGGNTRLAGAMTQVVDTTAVDFTSADRTKLDAVKAKTDNLPATPAATGDAMTLTAGERNSIAAALLDLANGVETGYTMRQTLRVVAAALAGILSGALTSTVLVQKLGGGTVRITATVDAAGNRSAIVLNTT